MSIRKRLHEDLLTIYRAGVSAVQGQNLMSNCLKMSPDGKLSIKKPLEIGQYPNEMEFNLAKRNVYIIGAGKGVLGLCEGFLRTLDSLKTDHPPFKFIRGQLNVPIGSKYDKNLLGKYKIDVEEAAKDNMPDERAMEATQKMIHLIHEIKEKNKTENQALIVAFITGGASALLTMPKKPLKLEQKREVIKKLQHAGATIHELNLVRQTLSQVKGGKLAQMMEPIETMVFIVSDVNGDVIPLIGGGPTVPSEIEDPCQVALDIIAERKVKLDDAILNAIKDEKARPINQTAKLHNILIANNYVAVHSALMAAKELGYRTIVPNCGAPLSGEAKGVAGNIAHVAKSSNNLNMDEKKLCWISGGETTVNMSNTDHGKLGIGGRCQEMGLSFLIETWDLTSVNAAFMAAGTDGQDGPTSAAGAIVLAGQSTSKSAELLENAKLALSHHDSHTFFRTHLPECLIDTGGPTGTNVMDIYCLLKAKE